MDTLIRKFRGRHDTHGELKHPLSHARRRSDDLELDLTNQIPINDAANRLNRNISRDEYPFTGRVPPLLHDVAVPLSNVSTSTPGRCRILLEQYADYTVTSEGVGLQQRPKVSRIALNSRRQAEDAVGRVK